METIKVERADFYKILNELKTIRIDIEFIKDNILDMDSSLTPEEEERLNKSLTEFKQGNVTSFADFEKEINNA